MREIEVPHPRTQSPDVIVTGATGQLGRFLMLELLRRGRRVLALVRNSASRRPELAEWFSRQGVESEGLSVAEFSLEDWAAGHGTLAELDVSRVKDVYHLAARFEFGLAPEVARAANVDASLRFLEAVSELSTLRRYVSVSGYRVGCGDRQDGRDAYARLGAYEASKREEHRLLRRRAEALGVSLSVVNPSSVIGDAESGETFQVTGVGEVARQLFQGRLRAQVGSPRTFVPLVDARFVASFMAELPLHDTTAGGEFWLLHPASPNLPELIDGMARTLGVAAPRLRLPTSVVRALPRSLTGAEPESLSFLSEDRYPSAEADAVAKAWGIPQADFGAALDAWLGYLVGTGFLRREARSPRFVSTRAGQILAEGDPGSELVLLHGLPLDGTSWDPLLAALGAEALVVDLPGLGRSGRQAPDFAFDDATWLDDLGMGAGLRLVGHSLGCAPALDFAARHPKRVAELLLVAPAFAGAEMSWWLRCPPLVRGLLRFGGVQRLEQQLYGGAPVTGGVVEHAYQHLQRPAVRQAVARALAWAGDPAVRKRALEKLALVVASGVSVRVFAGELDGLRTDELPPGVEAWSEPQTGHYPQLTQPARLARWLSGRSKSTWVQPEVAQPSIGS